MEDVQNLLTALIPSLASIFAILGTLICTIAKIRGITDSNERSNSALRKSIADLANDNSLLMKDNSKLLKMNSELASTLATKQGALEEQFKQVIKVKSDLESTTRELKEVKEELYKIKQQLAKE